YLPREVDDDFRLFPRRVILHLAVDHDGAGAVRHRLKDLLCKSHLGRIRRKDSLRDFDLTWMQCPGPGAAQQEGVSELRFTGLWVGKVAKGTIKRFDAVRRASVDHASDRIVPGILLSRSSWRVIRRRI